VRRVVLMIDRQGCVLEETRAGNLGESSIADGELEDEIAALRRQPGAEIIAWGGAGFAPSLSRAGLVDEYVLRIQPVALGGGLPMFRDLPDPLRLELLGARTFDTGTVLQVYEPSHRAGLSRS
jgi:dihydrofolate reductase